MSAYQDAVKELEARRCETCQGSGEVDDADLGDIYYNKWTCAVCRGSGFAPTETATISSAVLDDQGLAP